MYCSVGGVGGVHSSTNHQLQGTSSTLLLSQAADELRHSRGIVLECKEPHLCAQRNMLQHTQPFVCLKGTPAASVAVPAVSVIPAVL